jgi:hypothetical protein
MIRILIALIVVVAVGLPARATAQSRKTGVPKTNLRERTGGDAAAMASEAAQRLKEASENGGLEKARLAAEEALKNEQDLAGKAKAAADSLMKEADVEEEALRAKGEAAMREAMKNLSSEGRALLKDPEEKDTAAPQGPMPKPLKPLEETTAQVLPDKVTILARDSGFFDANEALGIFVGDVKVYHPQFYLECEELEVHMEKDAMESSEKSDAAKAGLTDAILAEAGPGASEDETGGIKMAIAKGPKVLIQKRAEDGEMQIAICKEATFLAETGEMTLRVWPQVQRGQSLQIAADASTVMVLDQNGSLRTSGPSRTEIVRGDTSGESVIPPTPDGP